MARDSAPRFSVQSFVAPSRTAELIFAANLVASAEHRSGVPDGWIEAQRRQLPTEVLAFVPRLAGFWWPTMGLVDLLCQNGLYDDPQGFVGAVDALAIEDFLVALFNTDLTRDQVARLLQTRDWSPFTALLSRFSLGTPAALDHLVADPEGHRRGLIDLVLASDTSWFRQTFEPWASQPNSTVTALTKRLAVEDPASVLTSLREPPLPLPAHDYRSYHFVPSRLLGHPRVVAWSSERAVCFLQEGHIQATAPTDQGRELAEFLKVLADPTRMDILRLLCSRPSFGKELAEHLHLTTATVSRHLDQLKAAGLVREDKADANNVKQVRYQPDRLDERWAQLRAYLLHD